MNSLKTLFRNRWLTAGGVGSTPAVTHTFIACIRILRRICIICMHMYYSLLYTLSNALDQTLFFNCLTRWSYASGNLFCCYLNVLWILRPWAFISYMCSITLRLHRGLPRYPCEVTVASFSFWVFVGVLMVTALIHDYVKWVMLCLFYNTIPVRWGHMAWGPRGHLQNPGPHSWKNEALLWNVCVYTQTNIIWTWISHSCCGPHLVDPVFIHVSSNLMKRYK
jgi:hypothetical protein